MIASFEKSEFVLLAKVDKLGVVDERVEAGTGPADGVIVKSYEAVCTPSQVFKGTIRSGSISVLYTKRIGARTAYPEVTIRKGFDYALFLVGTGEPGRFRLFSPYWGAVRGFASTPADLEEAAKTAAGRGLAAGIEAVESIEIVPDPNEKAPPVAGTPPAADRPTRLVARLDGPRFAFATESEAQLWLVVENPTPGPLAFYAGDLTGFIALEITPEGAESAVHRLVEEGSVPYRTALSTVLAPGDAAYFPIDVSTFLRPAATLYRVRAALEFPDSANLPHARVASEPVTIQIGPEAARDAEKEARDRRFMKAGVCREVHEARLEEGRCARCELATNSRDKQLCRTCASELGVCPFCLKKRE